MAMRVLHVVESLRPEAGSVAIPLAGLLRALSERDVEPQVITADGSAVPGTGVASTEFAPAGVLGLVRGVDLVHIHGWGGHLARTVATVARKTGKPYMISPLGGLCDGPYSQKTWRDRVRALLGETSLIRSAAAVAAMNKWEQHELKSRGVNSNIPVLSYGLDFGEYESQGEAPPDMPPAPQGRLVLLLGPIHPVEGLVPFLKAFAEVAAEAEGWSIIVAGRDTGEWRRMLEAAIRRKGAADRVTFAPAADIAAQREWLARAAVLATPSLHIRCPVSIIQALAAGVPVVASKLAVPDGLDGAMRVCEPNRAALKEAMRSVLKLSDDDRAAEAQRSRDIARSIFDWSVLTDVYVRLYGDMLQK